MIMPDSDTSSDYHSMVEDDVMSDSGSPRLIPPVFGPQVPIEEAVNPLGKEIRIRIDIDGCTGLPPKENWENKDHRHRWHLRLYSISSSNNHTPTRSSEVFEGKGIHRGTVQWNETIYIDCLELSPISIDLHNDAALVGLRTACVPISDVLGKAEIILLPCRQLTSDPGCTVFFSASRVLGNCDNEMSRLDPAKDIQCNDLHIDPKIPPNLWRTVFCQLPPFWEALSRSLLETHREATNVNVLAVTKSSSPSTSETQPDVDSYWPLPDVWLVQGWTFISFEKCQEVQSPYHPQIHKLLTAMETTMNAVLRSPNTLARHGSNIVIDVVKQLFWLTDIMQDLAQGLVYESVWYDYREAELARLIVIIGTPDPNVGVSSTSARTNCDTISGTITKDALLLALEAIVQASDAFPPLKSAASGLLFFATCADTASGNKKQIRDIYRRVEGLTASLKRGVRDGDMILPAHQEAIAALAQDVAILSKDLQDIIKERKSRFKRFFSAKRHREELKNVINQLEVASLNYMMAMATLNGVALAEVRGCVKAMALVMEVSPVYAPGTRRADAVAFPNVLAHIEEV